MKSLLSLIVLVGSGASAFSQDRAEMEKRLAALPVEAPSVIAAGGLDGFTLNGAGASIKAVVVAGQAFSSAVQIRTMVKPEKPYSVQLTARTTGPIRKGDVLLATFWARGLEHSTAADEPRTEFVLELAHEPYTKSGVLPAALDEAWTKFYVPCYAVSDIAAGEGTVGFRCGYDPQVFEIAGLTVRNFGTSVKLDALPYTPSTYTGRAADAPWRKAAAERIEKIRKGDLTVAVADAAGKPVPGAQVRVVQKKSAFGWGTAVDAGHLLADGADADRYRATLLADFNKVVIENDLKWERWEKDRATGAKAVAWLREHGLPVRGHCLVWPGKKNLPQDVLALFAKPEELGARIAGHIAEEVNAFRGQLIEWDVLNEPFTNTDVQAVLGDAVMIDWFKAARAADPSARLFINDYSILESGGRDSAHQDHYFKTIKLLQDGGAPVQGIGIQGHFSEDLTAIPRLIEILDRFATFGLPIQITEFDINTYDEQLQADYTRDFLTAMFAHESTSGVLVWGFWEKRHWIPASAFYRADWSPRLAAKVWKELTQKKWWTESTTKTDAAGAVKVRGFLGDYDVTVFANGKTTSKTVTLTRDGTRLDLRLGN